MLLREDRLGVGEFFLAASVATLFDERAGLSESVAIAEEAGAREQNVGHVETHRPRFRDFPGFVQVRSASRLVALQPPHPRPREQPTGQVVGLSRLAEAVDDGVARWKG